MPVLCCGLPPPTSNCVLLYMCRLGSLDINSVLLCTCRAATSNIHMCCCAHAGYACRYATLDINGVLLRTCRAANDDAISALVRKHVPAAIVSTRGGTELSFKLPRDDSSR